MVLQTVMAGDLCDKSEGFDTAEPVSWQNGSDSRTNGRVRIKRNEEIEKQKTDCEEQRIRSANGANH